MPRTRTVRTLSAIFGAASVLTAAPGALAIDLVFADVLNDGDPMGNSIRRVGADGTGLQTIIPTGGGVRGVDVDSAAGMVYWTDTDNFVIRRARLDGTNQQDLVTSLGFPMSIRLDLTNGKFVWGDLTNEEVRRANFDGGSQDFVFGGTPFFSGLAIDNVNNRVYWSLTITASTGRIVRSNFDGSDLQTVIPTSGTNFKPRNIALDVAGGKIYWTDAVTRFVRRANLDGTNMQDLFNGTEVGSPKGITLDLAAGHIYWGQEINDADSGGFLFGEIRRMNLDGTGQQLVISGVGSVNDIAIFTTQTCRADINNSGELSVQDIFDFLAAYFGNEPAGDFNQSGAISVQDIFDFLAAYFAGCP